MATNPKMAPCPKCKSSEFLSVYTYDSGWRYVECDGPGCWYSGPGEGSIRQAIKSHNERTKGDAKPATEERYMQHVKAVALTAVTLVILLPICVWLDLNPAMVVAVAALISANQLRMGI